MKQNVETEIMPALEAHGIVKMAQAMDLLGYTVNRGRLVQFSIKYFFLAVKSWMVEKRVN